MIHYHGTPITPQRQLLRMVGRFFCVSYANPQNLPTCLQIGQGVMLDNGAFSAFTKGVPFNETGFYGWIEPHLAHPHWAVIPDVIGGSVEDQRSMVSRWPFSSNLGYPVWHLGLPIDYLLELADGWGRICFGSSAEYWQAGTSRWCGRMDEAFNALARRGTMPWVHGLRMLGQTQRWPLASADSTNVAQNFKRYCGCAECMAHEIDAVQPPLGWKISEEQIDMFHG